MQSRIRVGVLAGGLGTRLSEETENKPKPMVAINGQPILWHLMNIFSFQECNDFIIALGYRGDVIKRWLLDIQELSGDLYFDGSGSSLMRRTKSNSDNWKVLALETGLETQTGGRIRKMLKQFPGERMLVTYGDGLANISIQKLLDFHSSHGKLATLTAVRPPARFGHLQSSSGLVTKFGEKNQLDVGWINGGFFVLEPEVVEFIGNDLEPFETGALARLIDKQELMAFEHAGFWQPMDTLRERDELSKMAKEEPPPWLRNNNYSS